MRLCAWAIIGIVHDWTRSWAWSFLVCTIVGQWATSIDEFQRGSIITRQGCLHYCYPGKISCTCYLHVNFKIRPSSYNTNIINIHLFYSYIHLVKKGMILQQKLWYVYDGFGTISRMMGCITTIFSCFIMSSNLDNLRPLTESTIVPYIQGSQLI